MCQKPVDRVEWYDSPMRMVKVIRAFCHGEVDTCELSHETLMEYGNQLAGSEAVAFTKGRING